MMTLYQLQLVQGYHMNNPNCKHSRSHNDKEKSLQRREMVPLLFELKNNPQVLEDVLPPVEERYGPELCQFIRMTLRRGYQQRPSSMELTELPFIQKCLGLSYSDLHKGLVAGVFKLYCIINS